jgi:hypothetical protein
MNIPCFRHLLASLALTAVLTPVAFAEPPADKGKNANATQPAGKDQKPEHDGNDDGNRGQVVSECNHRANSKELKGKERKEYVEWCTERGERYHYDDRRYDQDRSCYRRADEKGLSGDFRRVFVQDCLRKQEKNR